MDIMGRASDEGGFALTLNETSYETYYNDHIRNPNIITRPQ